MLTERSFASIRVYLRVVSLACWEMVHRFGPGRVIE